MSNRMYGTVPLVRCALAAALMICACRGRASEAEYKTAMREVAEITTYEEDLPACLPAVIRRIIMEYHLMPVPWGVVITDIPQNDDNTVIQLSRFQEQGISAIDFEMHNTKQIYRIPLFPALSSKRSCRDEGPLVPRFDKKFDSSGDTWIPDIKSMPWLSDWIFTRSEESILAEHRLGKTFKKIVWEKGTIPDKIFGTREFYLTLLPLDETRAYLFIYDRVPCAARESYAGSYEHSAGRRIITATDMTGNSYIPWVRAITSTFDIIAEEQSREKLPENFVPEDLQHLFLTTTLFLCPHQSDYTQKSYIPLYTTKAKSTLPNAMFSKKDFRALYDNGYMIYGPWPLPTSKVVPGSLRTAFVCYSGNDHAVLRQLAYQKNRTISWKKGSWIGDSSGGSKK